MDEVRADGAEQHGQARDAPLTLEEAHRARVHARHARLRRRARRTAIGIGALVLLGLVALGALVFVLQTEFGRGRVQSIALAQIENILAEDAEVTLERLDGTFLTGARMTGLTIRRYGETLVQVDTLVIDYKLRTLLRRRFSAGDLYVGGLAVYVRQRADSTFNTAGLIRERDQEGTLTFEVDDVSVRRGRAEVHWLHADRDSAHVVDNLTLRASRFHAGPDSLVGRIDGIDLDAIAPFGASRMSVNAAGAFSRERVVLDRLRATSSEGTDVSGRFFYAFRRDALPVFDADIEATPLALADARAFAGAPLYGDARMRLTSASTGNVLTLALRGAIDEAAIVLDAEMTADPDAGPVRYRAEGTLRRLDPGALTRNPALAATINGDLRVDLAGRSLRTLSGPFNVTLRETRVAGQRLDRLTLDGTFDAGRVAFALVGALPGAALRAEGSARPFERVPVFEVRGRADELDLARLLPNVQAPANLAGDFAFEGRGNSVETLYGTAALALDRAAFGNVRLAGAELDATFQGGRVLFDADARLGDGGGRVLAAGEADTRAEPLAYRVTRGRVENLDLAALTGNPEQASDLSGTFTLDGRGTDPRAATLRAVVGLADSRFGAYDLVAARADVRLARGLVTFDTDADLGRAGRLAAAGTARPFAEPLTYQASGRVENLDLAALTGNPAQASDLTGAFDVDGRGTDPGTLVATARLRLGPSAYGTQQVAGSDVTLVLRQGALAVTGTVETPEGQFALDVSGRPFDARPALAFGSATCFAGLDVGRLTGNPDLETRLNGCFEGQIAGYGDLPTADAGGTLTLRPSTVNDAEIRRATARFTLASGALGATAALAFGAPGEPEAGQTTLAFQGRPFDETPTYALRGTTRDLDLNALTAAETAQTARLSFTFDADGAGFAPETARLRARLAGGSSRIGPARIDTVQTRLALAEGVLTVDTLLVRSDLANATAAGTLALFNARAASAFRLDADVVSLTPLSAYTAEPLGLERGELALTVTGAPGAPLALDGQLAARQFVYGENAITGLEAQLAAEWDPRTDTLAQAVNARLRGSFDVLSTPALFVETGSAEAVFDDGVLTLDGSIVLDRNRDLTFFTRADFDPQNPGVLVERGQFRIGQDTWQLAQPARIITGDVISVRGLLLATADGQQQIAVDGELDFQGEQNFVVTIEDVEVAGLTDLVRLEGIGGRLSGSLVLTGPAAAPLLDGTLAFDELSSRGETFGSLDARVGYAEGRFTIDAALAHVDGEQLTIAGYVPRQFSLVGGDPVLADAAAQSEVEIRVHSEAFPVAWAQPLLQNAGLTELGGRLQTDLTITGTQAAPRLAGTATLTDGRLGLEATGVTYAPVQARLGFAGNQITLEEVRILDARRGETRLDVAGQITLSELSVGELDLTVTPTQFVALDTPTFRRLTLDQGSAPLRLTGTLDAPRLRGAVVVARGDIFLTDELVSPDLEVVELAEADVRAIEARYGRRVAARDTAQSRFTDALDYDLRVEFNRNVWIRSRAQPSFDIEFDGSVQAVKPAFAEGSDLFGQINLVRGAVQTFGRRFVVRPSRLVFNGPASEAIVDLAATHNVRLQRGPAAQVQINLALQGQLNDNPEVRLTSDPPLDPADIVSLIATGQLSDGSGGTGGGGGIGGLAGGLALGQVSSLVEGAAGEALGLDLVEIDIDPSGELVIRLGRYLTDRAFVSFGYAPNETPSSRRGVGQGSRTEVSLEYQLLRWLALQAERGNQRGTGAGLLYEYAW